MLATCPCCGLSQDRDNNFCRNCGEQVDARSQARHAEGLKKQGKVAAAALLALALFLFALALYYRLFS